MRSFWAQSANSHDTTRIHPALTSFVDEVCGTLARLAAYVGTLALLAILGIHFWEQLPDVTATEPVAKPGWSAAERLPSAFAVSQFDSLEKTETYQILRHPEGGRRDVFHWAAKDAKPGEKPVAGLEIYRPGGELSRSGPAIAEIATRMEPEGMRELETAGIIDSKFGTVTLLRFAGQADGANSCLGFIKRFDAPDLQLSGWSCQGEALPARRAAISCMLSRLMLLTAGNDPKLAELFARAELRRGSCSPAATPATSADWVTGAENPLLRGTM
jgi:hypothetical protein